MSRSLVDIRSPLCLTSLSSSSSGIAAHQPRHHPESGGNAGSANRGRRGAGTLLRAGRHGLADAALLRRDATERRPQELPQDGGEELQLSIGGARDATIGGAAVAVRGFRGSGG